MAQQQNWMAQNMGAFMGHVEARKRSRKFFESVVVLVLWGKGSQMAMGSKEFGASPKGGLQDLGLQFFLLPIAVKCFFFLLPENASRALGPKSCLKQVALKKLQVGIVKLCASRQKVEPPKDGVDMAVGQNRIGTFLGMITLPKQSISKAFVMSTRGTGF